MEYDVLKTLDQTQILKISGNQINSLKKSTIQKNGIRRFENNKIFQASRLGEVTLDRLLADSMEWGGPGIDHDYDFSPTISMHKNFSFTNDKFFESYLDAFKYLKEKYPDYVFSGQCGLYNLSLFLDSSYGLDLATSGAYCNWHFSYVKKGSGNIIDGEIFGLNSKNNIIESVMAQEVFLRTHSNEVKINSKKIPVLIASETLPLQKLTDSLMINKYQDKAGLYSGKLGRKLFSDKITLFDSGYMPECGIFNFFDGEGVIREKDLVLIENGVFKNTICDLRYAKKYNTQSTGNGLRNYNSGVGLNFKNLKFKKQSKPWLNILKDYPESLIAFIAAGGESNDLGEFSTPVQIGYICHYGEIIGLAPQVTIKTSTENYLNDGLIDISSDGFTADSPSACIISEMDVIVN